MAGNLSLESSIRTCKIDPGYADKVFSDRFLNPCNMMCPIWNGYDSAGRPACPDTYNTKRAGCNSAEDRIHVENYQRPQYMEYVNLSTGGIAGNFYGKPSCRDTMTQWNVMKGNSELSDIHNITGNFGNSFASTVYPSCGVNQYRRAMAQNAETLRRYTAMDNGMTSACMKMTSGM